MSKLLTDEEIAEMADKLVKEIEEAGGMQKYYDGLYGEGAYLKDLAQYSFPPEGTTIH